LKPHTGGISANDVIFDKPLQYAFLEAIDYQLFAVYTVEKWIGVCLKGWG